MTIKKLFKPRILFPTVILLLLIISFILSVILAPSPFHVEQIDNPGDVKISWEEISEEEFYENMTVAMNVTFEKEPTYYFLKEPGSDVEMPLHNMMSLHTISSPLPVHSRILAPEKRIGCTVLRALSRIEALPLCRRRIRSFYSCVSSATVRILCQRRRFSHIL